jgi:penicillin-binding protein 1B
MVVAGVLAASCFVAVLFTFYYLKYANLIDRKLRTGPFSQSMNIYAAPVSLETGDKISPEQIVAQLRQSGYSMTRNSAMGRYNIRPQTLEIFPGRDSYFGPDPAVIHFSGGRISKITSLRDNAERTAVELEPRLITNLSEKNREKRRIVRYQEIPPALVNAVVSAEDKRFFQHGGLDILRIAKAAWVDLRQGRKEQGASTLSMQLARNLWLEPAKSWKRKIAEGMMTMHLEHKLSKEQIFEDYSNQVYLGRRSTFSIHGFGQAARAYFGKNIGQLTLPEAALLAGMVQRPSYFNPVRYPDRVRERRQVVLGLMKDNGYITEAQYREASEAPVRVSTSGDTDSLEAQYFVDLVNDELQSRIQDKDIPGDRVYTTLDMDLQRAAEEAVRTGMAQVDAQLKERRKKEHFPAGQPQVALIALDPHTGEIKALVGGRNYLESQFDHALAARQPGSAFKPFVYAAALDTAIEGGPKIFTPASTVMDTPATFLIGNQEYAPGNYHQQFMGEVTLRKALAHSLNVATVKLAQAVGYDLVVEVARRAGLKARPTPSAALGTYENTPLQVAGAYTVFANNGTYVRPSLVAMVRGQNAAVVYAARPETRRALDGRVAYLMTAMLQEVMRSGTAAGVRARGYTAPAAGKTGTSRDGWFAGYTSQLLCVVWVGFDDNRDLNLEGARSALPIWTEFMKRAQKLRAYDNPQPFRAPGGIINVQVCNESGQLATPYCPERHTDVFIENTQPGAECQIHGSLRGVVALEGEADRIAPLDTIRPLEAAPASSPPPLRPYDDPR